MSFFNALIHDLRDKRLWPLAAALVAALLAVPLLLSSGGKSTPVAQAPQTAPAAGALPAGAVPVVGVSSSPTSSRLTGSGRDPFTQQVTASSAAALGLTGRGGSSSAGSASSGVSSAAAVHPTTSTPASSSGTVGQPQLSFLVFVVDLTFGKAGSSSGTYKDVARLSPFPSAKHPLLVFLGVKNDGKTAVFLISSLAAATGHGKCLPSPRRCEFLELTSGQRERFLVSGPHGSLTEYDLALTAVETTPVTSFAKAMLAHARMSPAGRQIVAHAAQISAPLWSWSYSFGTGLLSYDSLLQTWLVHHGLLSASSAAGVVLQPAGSR